MNPTLRWPPLLATVMVALSLAFPAHAHAQAQAPAGVVVETASVLSFPLSAEALGNARANEAVDIRPQIDSTVTAIRFEEGQEVNGGAVLVELEDSEERADLAAARAQLADSNSQYRRAAELIKSQAVSESQLLQLEARRDADQAAVEAAQSRLTDTVVRAPFAGRIGLRRVSLGSLVGPDTIITTLDDTSVIKVDFDVPEVYLARLQPGLDITARSAAWPGVTFTGEVASVDTRVDPVSRTIAVRALVPNPEGRLRPGMFLNVTLLREDVEALMIPEQALVPERSRQFVYLVDDEEVVHLREVQIGRRRPGQVEIVGGLEPGERVVIEGTQKVRDGDPVAILERGVLES